VVLAAERGASALDLTRLRRLAWAIGALLPELVDEDRVLPRTAGHFPLHRDDNEESSMDRSRALGQQTRPHRT
jgi:hypothetical protein